MALRRKRELVEEWRRPKGGVWHAFLADNVGAMCGGYDRELGDAGEGRWGRARWSRARGEQVRGTLPESADRLCADCQRVLGLRRRRARSIESGRAKLAERFEAASREVLEAWREIAAAAPKLLRLALSQIALLDCTRGRGEGGGWFCDEGDVTAAKCVNCVARHDLEEAAAAFAHASRAAPTGPQPRVQVRYGSDLYEVLRIRSAVARQALRDLKDEIGRVPIAAEFADAMGFKSATGLLGWLGWLGEKGSGAKLDELWYEAMAEQRPKGGGPMEGRWRPTLGLLELQARRDAAVDARRAADRAALRAVAPVVEP